MKVTTVFLRCSNYKRRGAYGALRDLDLTTVLTGSGTLITSPHALLKRL